MPQLLTTSSASGGGTPSIWGGGAGQFEASGTFNGATVSLQSKNLDGTYTDVTGTALTSTGRALFQLPPCTIRANATSAPTSVSAAANRLRSP